MTIVDSTKQILKDNPVKSTLSVVGSIATLVGALFALDARYAHAGDVQTYQKSVQKQLIQMQHDNVDSKVFEMELRKSSKPKQWTTVDQAILDKYKRDLEGLDTQKKDVESK